MDLEPKTPALLAGLLYGERGKRLTPTHAVKKGRRYRYYISQDQGESPNGDSSSTRRIPAGGHRGPRHPKDAGIFI